jgi:predicted nucleic acid-binding protein
MAQRRPAVSELGEVELVSAVARKLRRGELGRADAERIKAAFFSHLEGSFYTRSPLEGRHFRQARDWIGSFGSALRCLDALHLAVASTLGLPLATADEAQARGAAQLGLKVIFVG